MSRSLGFSLVDLKIYIKKKKEFERSEKKSLIVLSTKEYTFTLRRSGFNCTKFKVPMGILTNRPIIVLRTT